ncbi:MAG: T9SS type A sorting domain-containing protein, partial [Calditrichaeota bacterium]|nr:T9SS type A sorting domain-containing protein [Calditrichota bacterium]
GSETSYAVGRASLPAGCELQIAESIQNPKSKIQNSISEILVYAGDRLVGSGLMADGVCGIAVWGDDPTTEEIDGAIDGEELQIANCKMKSKIQNPKSKISYRTDDFKVIELDAVSAACPTEFGLTGVYPNPFNSELRVGYSLESAGEVRLGVYDVGGREVARLVSGKQEAGVHNLLWDASNITSGVYILHCETGGRIQTRKIALVR